MLKGKTIYVLAALLLCIAGCKDKNKDNGFDRAAMLSNLGNNVIAPVHQQFAAAAATLKQQADAFTNNPTVLTLQSFKTAYTDAYIACMAVETYSFDPSAEFRVALNSFPPDTDRINTNAASLPGSYNLSSASNVRAKGFPAIDYLLFSSDEATTVSLFSSANRQAYLAAIVNEIKEKAEAGNSGWGTYLQAFTAADGIDVGSSVGILVNDIAFETERCRRERVGNSLGYVGLITSGTIHPLTLEAYYSRQSKELLIANLQQLKNLYEGGSGQGFDDYLSNINADYYGEPLSTAISTQFDLAMVKANAVNGDFATALVANKAQMEELFLELKKLTVMLKVDMSSQLGVVINYSDNDGD